MENIIDDFDAELLDCNIVFSGKCYVVSGYILNDKKSRFVDGIKIRTSYIKSIDFDTGIVKTLNSIYKTDLIHNFD